MNWFRLTPSRSATRASSAWSWAGMRRSSLPLGDGFERSSGCSTAADGAAATGEFYVVETIATRLATRYHRSGLPDLLAQPAERVAEETGDVHLREPQLGGDTTLAQVPEVVQLDDPPLPPRK